MEASAMNKIKHYVFNPTNNTTKSFNSIIKSLSSQGDHHKVLITYSSMINTNTQPDTYTFPTLFKACASLELLSLGLSIHQHVIVNGFSSDLFTASSLINFYSKFGHPSFARKVFDMMPERDIVPWTAIIGAYSRAGDSHTAFSIFNQMRWERIEPNSVSLLEMLCGVPLEYKLLQSLHCCAMYYGFAGEIDLMNSMMNVYGKCGFVKDARGIFELMNQIDIISWNSLILGYAQIGDAKEIFRLCSRMKNEGFELNEQTIVSLMSAIAIQCDIEFGRIVHGHILRSGFYLDVHVKTSLLSMYLKCGDTDLALRAFVGTPDTDVVLWNAMISGLVHNDCADKGLDFFGKMLKLGMEPSATTVGSVLAASAQLSSFRIGTSIHGYMLRKGMTIDIPALNSLMTMYAKCGHLEQCSFVFERMYERDLVSWNVVIDGYARSGFLSNALCLFNEMKGKTDERPDSLTIISLLQACALVGALHQGKLLHSFVIRSCLSLCLLVDTTLVDMYSKCGDLRSAHKCFDKVLHKDLVTWSTIIAGYGCHGKGEAALELYEDFLHSGIEPNDIILLSVLSACNHNGLLHQGLRIFHSMTTEFGIQPKLEHRACIVDLLCRARRVDEAYEFYNNNFSEPVVDVLGIILDACRANGKMKLGDMIARDILTLKPGDAGNYVQIAHCYASMNRWDGVGEAWTEMRSLGLKKLPAWSFIEINGVITTFFMNHNSHSLFDEIVLTLKGLGREMRKNGSLYSEITQFMIHYYET